MRERVPLMLVEGRLVLLAVIECDRLRVRRQLIEFVIDTGSPSSYLSHKDVMKFQIPTRDRSSSGEVEVGGSRFFEFQLPEFDMYPQENISYLEFEV